MATHSMEARSIPEFVCLSREHHVPGFLIEIVRAVPHQPTWSAQDWQTFYHHEAEVLADTLMQALPAGTIRALVIALMQQDGRVVGSMSPRSP